MITTPPQIEYPERCPGSEVQVDEIRVVAGATKCRACGKIIAVYKDPINLRVIAHSRPDEEPTP